MKLINSFKFAFRGVLSGIKNEMNFRIHTVAAITVIIFSCIYGVDSAKAALLTLTICLVMVAELINTAVEAMVDIISPEKTSFAKIAKDSSAGAVLVLAIGAVIIAFLTFSDMEKLKNVLFFIKENIAATIIYIVICILYVFFFKSIHKRKDMSK